jgi:hypothetical protein
MGLSQKYGQVTFEKGNIPEDMPVFVFLARDINLPKVLGLYWNLCEKTGSPKHHLDLICKRIDEICNWQDAHPELVHVPNSNGYEHLLEKPVGVPQGEEVE